ncbi:hypothetical protein WJX84_006018 [Apatococcus fuscideae]|uniref:Uncharacterized protein n=1 Tax=Apatococcus fuscideae TaxID=2026836 RepID=A0AAW1SN31_9CHLO
MRQCLHFFFPAFASFSASNRLLLARAVLPAARLAIRTADKPKQSKAPLILKFAVELLQIESSSRDDGNGAAQQEVWVEFAELCLAEAQSRPITSLSKPYILSILKVLQQVPFEDCSAASLKELKVLADRLHAQAEERMVVKEAKEVVRSLQALDRHPDEVLMEEQLEELMQRVRQHGQEAEDQLEGVFDKAEPPTPTRSRTGRGGKVVSSAMRSTAKTARRRPATSKNPLPSSDDSADADGPQMESAHWNSFRRINDVPHPFKGLQTSESIRQVAERFLSANVLVEFV